MAGIYAAALTPLTQQGAPDLEALPGYLSFLAERGCHGALLLGTTGEGPSFSTEERRAIWLAAAQARAGYPGLRLLAATGTPSLSETIVLNKIAFDLGYDAVVVLPPYYFRDAGDDGLFDWFAQVIESSVPRGSTLLGYHIPAVSGVGLSLDLLQRLRTAYPRRFGGLKDSSGDLAHAQTLAHKLEDRLLLVGNDSLLGPALEAGAAGCISAMATLVSPQLRALWDAHARGEDTQTIQTGLNHARSVLEHHPPAPAFLKALLHELHGFPHWPLRPPLRDFSPEQTKAALSAFQQDLP